MFHDTEAEAQKARERTLVRRAAWFTAGTSLKFSKDLEKDGEQNPQHKNWSDRSQHCMLK